MRTPKVGVAPVEPGYGDYKVMRRKRVTDQVITLSALQPDDIDKVRKWRNRQLGVLRQGVKISRKAQENYFLSEVWPDKQQPKPNQLLLGIKTGGRLIGYGGLVNISWANRNSELSFLLDPKIEGNSKARTEFFIRYLRIILEIAFSDLNLLRVWTETYENRGEHIAGLEEVGFVQEGRLRSHILCDDLVMDSLLHGLLRTEWRLD